MNNTKFCHGKRLDCNKSRVQVTKVGQYRTTIPKNIATAFSLDKNSILEFTITINGINITKYKTTECE